MNKHLRAFILVIFLAGLSHLSFATTIAETLSLHATNSEYETTWNIPISDLKCPDDSRPQSIQIGEISAGQAGRISVFDGSSGILPSAYQARLWYADGNYSSCPWNLPIETCKSIPGRVTFKTGQNKFNAPVVAPAVETRKVTDTNHSPAILTGIVSMISPNVPPELLNPFIQGEDLHITLKWAFPALSMSTSGSGGISSGPFENFLHIHLLLGC